MHFVAPSQSGVPQRITTVFSGSSRPHILPALYRSKLSISFNIKSYVFKLRLNKFGVSITTNDRDARCSGLANSFENLGLEKSLTDVVLRNPKSGTLRIMGTEIDRSLGNSFPNSSFESFLWCHVHVPPRNPRLVIESFELSDGEVTPQWSGQKRPMVVRSKPANGC